MKDNIELKEFFKEVAIRFNCSKTAQQKYNRNMSNLIRKYHTNINYIKVQGQLLGREESLR